MANVYQTSLPMDDEDKDPIMKMKNKLKRVDEGMMKTWDDVDGEMDDVDCEEGEDKEEGGN